MAALTNDSGGVATALRAGRAFGTIFVPFCKDNLADVEENLDVVEDDFDVVEENLDVVEDNFDVVEENLDVVDDDLDVVEDNLDDVEDDFDDGGRITVSRVLASARSGRPSPPSFVPWPISSCLFL